MSDLWGDPFELFENGPEPSGLYDYAAERIDAEREALQRGIDRDSRPMHYGEDVPSRREVADE